MKEILKSLLKLSPIPLSRNHKYDIQTKKIIRKYLRPNSCCVDVGCFKGEILDLLIRQCPEGQHYAFEPIPNKFRQLVKQFEAKKVNIFNLALSNSKGTTEFNHVLSNPSYSGLLKRTYDKKGEVDERIQVQTDRLDDVLPQGKQIDLIKIDVEGAEYLVLQGATNTIKTYQPLVIFEHGIGGSDHYGVKPSDVFAYFQTANMRISTLSALLSGKAALTRAEFDSQFYDKLNYYFIAHP